MAIQAVFFVLGTMSVRGIREAREEMCKMVRPAYWRDANFSFPKSWDVYAPRDVGLAGNALISYAAEEGPEADGLIRAVAEETVPEDERKALAPFLARAKARLHTRRPEENVEIAIARIKEQRERFPPESPPPPSWTTAVWSGSRREVLLGVLGVGLLVWFVFRLRHARGGKASQAGRAGPVPPVDAGEKKP